MEKNSEQDYQDVPKQSQNDLESEIQFYENKFKIHTPYLEHLHQLDFPMNQSFRSGNNFGNLSYSLKHEQNGSKQKIQPNETPEQQSHNYVHDRYITPSKYVDQLNRVSLFSSNRLQNFQNIFNTQSDRNGFSPYMATLNKKAYVDGQVYVDKQESKVMLDYFNCTKKVKLLSWVRKCIRKVTAQKLYTVKQYYNQFQVCGNYENLFEVLNQRYSVLIENVCPDCTDFNNRKTQLFKFFVFFFSIAVDDYKQDDLHLLFKYQQSFGAFLILTANIFNFCYNAKCIDYFQYCQIFSVGLVQAYQPINWFGRCKNIPAEVNDFLFSLESRILLIQIWKTKVINELISEQLTAQLDTTQNLNSDKMFRRMLFRLKQRFILQFYRISKKILKQQKHCRIFYPLLNYILKTKLSLFKSLGPYPLIFLILIMGLASQQQSNKPFIQEIFKQYNDWLANRYEDMLFTSLKQKQFNILAYYNQIFVPIMSQAFLNDRMNGYQQPNQNQYCPTFLTQFKGYNTNFQEAGGIPTQNSPQCQKYSVSSNWQLRINQSQHKQQKKQTQRNTEICKKIIETQKLPLSHRAVNNSSFKQKLKITLLPNFGFGFAKQQSIEHKHKTTL